jgi:hypothetical protein
MSWKSAYQAVRFGEDTSWMIPKKQTVDGTVRHDEGWKIHISGTADDRDEIMNAVYEALIANSGLCQHKVNKLDNVKLNKLCCIYPSKNKGNLKVVVAKIGTLLDDFDELVIKHEVRVGSRMYARYGSFTGTTILSFDQKVIADNILTTKPPWIRMWTDTKDDSAEFIKPKKSKVVSTKVAETKTAKVESTGGGSKKAKTKTLEFSKDAIDEFWRKRTRRRFGEIARYHGTVDSSYSLAVQRWEKLNEKQKEKARKAFLA